MRVADEDQAHSQPTGPSTCTPTGEKHCKTPYRGTISIHTQRSRLTSISPYESYSEDESVTGSESNQHRGSVLPSSRIYPSLV